MRNALPLLAIAATLLAADAQAQTSRSELIKAIDTNGDNVITLRELTRVIVIETRKYDANKNGLIDARELLSLEAGGQDLGDSESSEMLVSTREPVIKGFDLNRDGKTTIEEVAEESAKEKIRPYDKNRDGSISGQEMSLFKVSF